MTRRDSRSCCAVEVPLMRRLLALVGVVLLLAAGWAQAAHVHGDWLPHARAGVSAASDDAQSPGDEAGCPLCVAMHAATPGTVFAQQPGVSATVRRGVRVEARERGTVWPFVLFCRPPPVALG